MIAVGSKLSSVRTCVKTRVWNGLSIAKSWREFSRDAWRYQRSSTPTSRASLGSLTGRQLETQITKDYHRIEKGLAFGKPHRPFGADARERLAIALTTQENANGADGHVQHARSALEALALWNDTGRIQDEISPLAETLPKFEIKERDLENFFRSRRSIRSFDRSRPVQSGTVEKAVELAGTAPSVCNRQSWKAHYFTGISDVERILKHQSGNRGFGSEAAGVFIVTADIQLFSGSGERNQRWIDGGIFAMHLVTALHGLGVASCMLNWSKGNSSSNSLRREAQIPHQEEIIALIAIGYPTPGHRVARSPRRPLQQILQLH